VDASKQKVGPDAIASLFGQAGNVVVAKGRKVLTFDLAAADLDHAELAAAVIGPSGNLRAPTLRAGTDWLVGFHEDTYATLP
jgi:hypothetical protein